MVARLLGHQQDFPGRAAGLIVDGTLFKSLDSCRGVQAEGVWGVVCALGASQLMSAVTYHHWCTINRTFN